MVEDVERDSFCRMSSSVGLCLIHPEASSIMVVVEDIDVR